MGIVYSFETPGTFEATGFIVSSPNMSPFDDVQLNEIQTSRPVEEVYIDSSMSMSSIFEYLITQIMLDDASYDASVNYILTSTGNTSIFLQTYRAYSSYSSPDTRVVNVEWMLFAESSTMQSAIVLQKPLYHNPLSRLTVYMYPLGSVRVGILDADKEIQWDCNISSTVYNSITSVCVVLDHPHINVSTFKSTLSLDWDVGIKDIVDASSYDANKLQNMVDVTSTPIINTSKYYLASGRINMYPVPESTVNVPTLNEVLGNSLIPNESVYTGYFYDIQVFRGLTFKKGINNTSTFKPGYTVWVGANTRPTPTSTTKNELRPYLKGTEIIKIPTWLSYYDLRKMGYIIVKKDPYI